MLCFIFMNNVSAPSYKEIGKWRALNKIDTLVLNYDMCGYCFKLGNNYYMLKVAAARPTCYNIIKYYEELMCLPLCRTMKLFNINIKFVPLPHSFENLNKVCAHRLTYDQLKAAIAQGEVAPIKIKKTYSLP